MQCLDCGPTSQFNMSTAAWTSMATISFSSSVARAFNRVRDIEDCADAIGAQTNRIEQQLMIDVVKENLDVDIKHPIRVPAPLARRPVASTPTDWDDIHTSPRG